MFTAALYNMLNSILRPAHQMSLEEYIVRNEPVDTHDVERLERQYYKEMKQNSNFYY